MCSVAAAAVLIVRLMEVKAKSEMTLGKVTNLWRGSLTLISLKKKLYWHCWRWTTNCRSIHVQFAAQRDWRLLWYRPCLKILQKYKYRVSHYRKVKSLFSLGNIYISWKYSPFLWLINCKSNPPKILWENLWKSAIKVFIFPFAWSASVVLTARWPTKREKWELPQLFAS